MVWLPGWTPDAGSSGFQGGLRSPGYPPRSPPAKLLLLRYYLRVLGWTPHGVDSQKNGSDASDMPRCAPQHTFSARKEPENNWLAVCLSPVRSPVAPEKPSPTQVWRVFSRITDGRLPVASPSIFTHHRRAAGSQLDSGWSPESSRVSTQRKWGEPSSDALSPSCLSGSMDLLHLSKTKVLQHFYARRGR